MSPLRLYGTTSGFTEIDAPAVAGSNTLTLPGGNGTNGQVLTTDGAGALSFTTVDKISEGNTEAEVVDTGSDGHFKVTTEGSERLRVDPSGRLLVGQSSSSNVTRAEFYGQSSSSTEQAIVRFGRGSNPGSAGDHLTTLQFAALTSGGVYATIEALCDATPGTNDYPGRLTFATTNDGASSPTERMRIKSNGDVGTFGAVDVIFVASSGAAGVSTNLIIGKHSATSVFSGTTSFVVRTNGNVINTNNSYGSISDAKLKENVVDAGSQWSDLKALQVRKYNFKEGQTHTQIGLVAQEVELVSPGLVSESPDRDEDGNDLGTVTKSVNYSVLYMKAVKALQEAMERIETLEARLTALEVTP